VLVENLVSFGIQIFAANVRQSRHRKFPSM